MSRSAQGNVELHQVSRHQKRQREEDQQHSGFHIRLHRCEAAARILWSHPARACRCQKRAPVVQNQPEAVRPLVQATGVWSDCKAPQGASQVGLKYIFHVLVRDAGQQVYALVPLHQSLDPTAALSMQHVG